MWKWLFELVWPSESSVSFSPSSLLFSSVSLSIFSSVLLYLHQIWKSLFLLTHLYLFLSLLFLFLNLIHLLLNVFEIFITGMKPNTSRVCVSVNGQGLAGGDFVRLCPLMPMFGCWVYRFLVLCFCFHFMSLTIWFEFKIIENNLGKLRNTWI